MNTKPIWSVAIDRKALYDDDSLVRGLHISQGAIDDARRSGSLRSIRIGARTLYLGEAILDWLEGLQATRQTTHNAANTSSEGGVA